MKSNQKYCSHYACNAIQQTYNYTAANNCEYVILTTFEKTWILKKENLGMKISEPFLTSPASRANEASKHSAQPFLKILFVAFSLMKNSSISSKEQLEASTRDSGPKSDPNGSGPNSVEFDDSTRSKRFKKDSNTHQSRSETKESSHNQHHLSIPAPPPPSISPISNPKATKMSIFTNIESLEFGSTIGEGRSGSVSKGLLDGFQVAIKVRLLLMNFNIVYSNQTYLSFFYCIVC